MRLVSATTFLAATLITGAALAAPGGKSIQSDAALVRVGRVIAEQNCSICHAIGKAGVSPNPLSPPFRTLSKNYPIEDLAEGLAEGISVGHPEMPRFEFSPRQVDALISYLNSVQSSTGKKPK